MSLERSSARSIPPPTSANVSKLRLPIARIATVAVTPDPYPTRKCFRAIKFPADGSGQPLGVRGAFGNTVRGPDRRGCEQGSHGGHVDGQLHFA